MKPIYLDYNASTPVIDEVAEDVVDRSFTRIGAGHQFPVLTKFAVDEKRRCLASAEGLSIDDVLIDAPYEITNEMIEIVSGAEAL